MSCLLSKFQKTVLGWSSLQTAEFMIIAIKVILSVCFQLNLSQNRIESPKLLSSFKLVFLLQATFSHPNPEVQSNLGFPGRSGVGGYHGTILFLTCQRFLFQTDSLYNRRFCRLLRRVLMRERSKTRAVLRARLVIISVFGRLCRKTVTRGREDARSGIRKRCSQNLFHTIFP